MVQLEDDPDDGDDEDRDLPQASDVEAGDADSVDTVVCPGCKRQVYEDADLCPHCGQFLLRDSSSRKPWWVIVGIVACLIVIVLLALR